MSLFLQCILSGISDLKNNVLLIGIYGIKLQYTWKFSQVVQVAVNILLIFFNFLGPVTKNQQVILSETPKKILSFVPTDAMNFTVQKNGYVRVNLF